MKEIINFEIEYKEGMSMEELVDATNESLGSLITAFKSVVEYQNDLLLKAMNNRFTEMEVRDEERFNILISHLNAIKNDLGTHVWLKYQQIVDYFLIKILYHNHICCNLQIKRVMGDWGDKIIEEAKRRVYNSIDELAEKRIQHLRGRIQEEGATVELINEPANKQLRVHFDNISDELKEAVLNALREKN